MYCYYGLWQCVFVAEFPRGCATETAWLIDMWCCYPVNSVLDKLVLWVSSALTEQMLCEFVDKHDVFAVFLCDGIVLAGLLFLRVSVDI